MQRWMKYSEMERNCDLNNANAQVLISGETPNVSFISSAITRSHDLVVLP